MLLTTALLAGLIGQAGAADPAVERGRYLVAVGGCNDCHTPGFAQHGEAVPEADRLVGGVVGFSGPWGVSYPANLRLQASASAEAEWMRRARAGGRPPMPWSALQAMTDEDLRAVYRYLRQLGPAGVAAPTAIAPGEPIPTPHFVFVPQPPTTTKLSAAR
ncbi:MAG: c-type cytochrome [Rhodocyclaceae bacterium]|nr:c-type cytochrome [Rhodocyclaceae bacterium]